MDFKWRGLEIEGKASLIYIISSFFSGLIEANNKNERERTKEGGRGREGEKECAVYNQELFQLKRKILSLCYVKLIYNYMYVIYL